MKTTRDTLLPILGTLYPWRRRIVYVTGAAFVLSIIFSLFMKDHYQGKTVFYAASQDLFKPEKVFGGSSQDMYYYGSGEDIDRILTVGNSHGILDFLIDSFELWSVYKIKPGSPKAHFKMRKTFKENYNILLTKQDALELTIEDTDPERAAAMANAATRKIDHEVKWIIKSSQSALSASYQKAILGKEKIMQGTLDSLMHFREKSGIYDAGEQTKLLANRLTTITNSIEKDKASLESLKKMGVTGKLRDTLNIMQSRITGLERELALLTSSDSNAMFSLPMFNLNKGKVELLESRYLRSYEQIGYDLEKVKLYNAAVEMDVSAIHLVEEAEVPLYKHRPKRSVIVLGVTIAAFLFSIAAALAVESFSRTDWKLVTAGPKA